jgi:hypothetical protein
MLRERKTTYAKRIVPLRCAQQQCESNQDWLDISHIAAVEVTSEDPATPSRVYSDQKKNASGGRWCR